MDSIFKIFIDIFRWLLFLIVAILLTICDLVYKVIKGIACYDLLTHQSELWDWFFGFIVVFMSFFIIFRLSKRYFKTLIDEQEFQSFDPINIILKIASIGVLVALLPIILKGLGSMVSKLIENIELTFGVTNNSLSSILLSGSSSFELETKTQCVEYVHGACKTQKTIQVATDVDVWQVLDEIKVLDANGDYKWLPDWPDFIILLGGAVFSTYLLVLIGLQIAGRYLSMTLKLIMAPYSISSIIDEKNDSFQTWWKLFVADFLGNYIQMILLLVGCTLFISADFGLGDPVLNGLAKIIAYCGALMGVLNAPSGVGQLIGADIGTQSALQSIQSTMVGAQAIKSIGGIAKSAAAGATYLTGRALGGKSIKDQIADANKGGGINISGASKTTPMSSTGYGDENSASSGPSETSYDLNVSKQQTPPSTIAKDNTVSSNIANTAKQDYKHGGGGRGFMYNCKVAAARGASKVGKKAFAAASDRVSGGKISQTKNSSNNLMNSLNDAVKTMQQTTFINNQQEQIKL